MAYALPNYTTIQQQVLADITAGLSVEVLQNDVLEALAQAVANQNYTQIQYLQWILLQCTPFTATGEYLEAWASLRNVFREIATQAVGQIVFLGIAGTTIPVGTTIANLATGLTYTINAAGDQGTTLSFTAVSAGSASNAPGSVQLTLTSPIVGISSPNAMTVGPITGGAGAENDISLRTRMLAAYRAPAQGGNNADYENWARSVAGVTRAWSYLVAAGQVGVFACIDDAEHTLGTLNGTNGGAALERRLPVATGDQLTIANYIYPLRPVTAAVWIESPTLSAVNIELQGVSDTLEDTIAAALANLFMGVGTPLGTSIATASLIQTITSAIGTSNFNLVSPTTTVSLAQGQLPEVGTFTFS